MYLTTTYGVPPLSQNVIVEQNTTINQIFGMVKILAKNNEV
jgi:hypothetical protein